MSAGVIGTLASGASQSDHQASMMTYRARRVSSGLTIVGRDCMARACMEDLLRMPVVNVQVARMHTTQGVAFRSQGCARRGAWQGLLFTRLFMRRIV